MITVLQWGTADVRARRAKCSGEGAGQGLVHLWGSAGFGKSAAVLCSSVPSVWGTHTYTHIHIYTYTYTYTYTYIRTYIYNTYIHTYILRTYIHTHIHTYYVSTYVRKYINTYNIHTTYVHTYILKFLFAYLYTDTHRYTNWRLTIHVGTPFYLYAIFAHSKIKHLKNATVHFPSGCVEHHNGKYVYRMARIFCTYHILQHYQ